MKAQILDRADQAEALRLADALLMYTKTMRLAGHNDGVTEDMDKASAELRRLHAENELLASASDKLRVAWRDEVHGLMQDKDQLRTQRDTLLEALRALVRNEGLDAYSYLDKGIGTATAAGQRWLNARAAIKAVKDQL